MFGYQLAYFLRAVTTLIFLCSVVLFLVACSSIELPNYIALILGITMVLLFFISGIWAYFELGPQNLNDQDFLFNSTLVQRGDRLFKIIFFTGLLLFVASSSQINRLRYDPERQEEYSRVQIRTACSLCIMFSSFVWPAFHRIYQARRRRMTGENLEVDRSRYWPGGDA